MAAPGKLVFTLLIFVSLLIPTYAAEWPQWRGPGRDGIWREEGIIQKFESPRFPVAWRTEIGNGYSGPTVANGRVYVTDRITTPKQVERILCFDAMTGDDVWSYEYECKYVNVGYPDGPRASVTIDQSYAYSLGTMGHLFCFEAATGEIIWSKDLDKEYDIEMPIWGIASAPLIEGNLLIVQVGGRDNACLIAFDKTTGAEKWKALDDKASYSSPIVIDQASKRVLVCLTGQRIVGLNPINGQLYWECPYEPSRMVIAVPTPVFYNNYLFVSSFYDGSMLLRVDQNEMSVEKLWHRKGPDERKTDALHCMISTPVLLGEHIYGVDSYGQLRCLDLRAGERIWESLAAVPQDRWANIHLVQNADKIWMFNERGELIISILSPEGFQEISRTQLIDPTAEVQLSSRGGVCWAHPAYAYKRVYIRNDKELLCADLSVED